MCFRLRPKNRKRREATRNVSAKGEAATPEQKNTLDINGEALSHLKLHCRVSLTPKNQKQRPPSLQSKECTGSKENSQQSKLRKERCAPRAHSTQTSLIKMLPGRARPNVVVRATRSKAISSEAPAAAIYLRGEGLCARDPGKVPSLPE